MANREANLSTGSRVACLPRPLPPSYTPKLKNDLPAFESADDPGQQFWDAFPFNPLPLSPTTVIDVKVFKQAIDSVSDSQCKLAAQVISDLEFGADTLVNLSKVPLEVVPNKFMPLDSAMACADQPTTMIKQKQVCGPFSAPLPFPEFQANPLFVIERHGKLRIILDLSSQEDRSPQCGYRLGGRA